MIFSFFQKQIRSRNMQLSHCIRLMAQQRRANLIPKGGLWYSEQGYTKLYYFWTIQCIVNIKKFLRCGCCSQLRLSSVSLGKLKWMFPVRKDESKCTCSEYFVFNNKVSMLAKCQYEMWSHNFICIPPKEVKSSFGFCLKLRFPASTV